MLFLLCCNATKTSFTGPPPIPVRDFEDLMTTAYFWRPNYQHFFGLDVPEDGPQRLFVLHMKKSRVLQMFKEYELEQQGRSQEQRRWGRYFTGKDKHS